MRNSVWPRVTASPSRNATWVSSPPTCASTDTDCSGSTTPFALISTGAAIFTTRAASTGIAGGRAAAGAALLQAIMAPRDISVTPNRA